MAGVYLLVRYIKDRSGDEGWAIVYGTDEHDARKNCHRKAAEHKAKVKSIS